MIEMTTYDRKVGVEAEAWDVCLLHPGRRALLDCSFCCCCSLLGSGDADVGVDDYRTGSCACIYGEG